MARIVGGLSTSHVPMIGRAIAAGLRARGCKVTLGARSEDEGRRAAAELGTSFARIDLADPDSCFDAVIAAGGFDILISRFKSSSLSRVSPRAMWKFLRMSRVRGPARASAGSPPPRIRR